MFKVIGTELYFDNQLVGTLFDIDRVTPTLRDDAVMALYGVKPETVRTSCPECGETIYIEG